MSPGFIATVALMSDDNRGFDATADGLLDRYGVQIEQTRAIGILETLASRLVSTDAVPDPLSIALDALEIAAWEGAEVEMADYAGAEGTDAALAAAITAGLALSRPERGEPETGEAFRDRLSRVKTIFQSWIGLGVSRELGDLKGVLGQVGGATIEPLEFDEDAAIDDGMAPPQFEIEIGAGLVPMVDETRGGTLVNRVRQLRRRQGELFGFAISPFRLRDDLRLGTGEYRFVVRGQQVAAGSVMVSRQLAIDPGGVEASVEGIHTVEPAFGLPAVWIDPASREEATANGYTVVDAETVLVTHLVEVVRAHLVQLFGWEEFESYLEEASGWAPGMFDELIPDRLSRSSLHQVLRNLLEEGVGIGDARTLYETLSETVSRWQHPDTLTEEVRQSLGGRVAAACRGDGFPVLALGPAMGTALTQRLLTSEEGALHLEDAETLLTAVRDGILAALSHLGGQELIVVTPPRVRGPIRRAMKAWITPVPIFFTASESAHLETPRPIGEISLADGFVPASADDASLL